MQRYFEVVRVAGGDWRWWQKAVFEQLHTWAVFFGAAYLTELLFFGVNLQAISLLFYKAQPMGLPYDGVAGDAANLCGYFVGFQAVAP